MSDATVSDAQQAAREKIRARLRERSSRLLSLLGLRNSAYAVKAMPPEFESPSKPESDDDDTLQSSHSVLTENTHGSQSTAGAERQGMHAHPSVVTDCPSSNTVSRAPEGTQVQGGKNRQSAEAEHLSQSPGLSEGMKRSRSTPGAITTLFTRKLSTTFGNPTVIRRSHLRSRPSIRAVQFSTAPCHSPSKECDSTNHSSDPSTPPSSGGSPLGTQSTPPTSEEPPSSPDESKHITDESAIRSKQSLDPQDLDTDKRRSPTERSSSSSPSIVTVEATANAKVFFETYFSTVYAGVNPRLQRQQELEHYIYSSSITSEEKTRVRKKWIAQEREYLRQCRVLKTRSHSAQNDKTVSTAGFEALKVLGKGSFGVVRLVREKQTCEEDSRGSVEETPTKKESSRRRIMAEVKKDVFAMKVIRKSAMIRNCQEGHLRAERDFLVASAKSRWIVPLIASFQDNRHLYLIMDYMVGGDFLSLLLRQCILREDITRWYVAEMILCVEEAHRLRWIHRDIKPDNFLISASGHLKISDFGLAFDGHWAHDQVYYNDHRFSLVKKLGIQVDGDAQDQKQAKKAERKSSSRREGSSEDDFSCIAPSAGLLGWRDRNQMRRMAKSVVGTSQYMAPEVIREHSYDGRCDWWSVGIILYECLFGFTPFASDDRQKTKMKIHHHFQTLRFPVHRSTDKIVSAKAVDLINSLLQDKEHRLSCGEYRKNDALSARSASRHLFHSFDTRNQDFRGFFVYPNDAADIKAHPFFAGVNWDMLHRSSPPFVPKVKGWEDTRYFDDWGNTQDNDNISITSITEHAEQAEVDYQKPSQENGGPLQNQELTKAPTIPDLKGPEAATKVPVKGRKKEKEKNRPRDKLLRDKRIGRSALEMRKKGAFLGYTYRRPKAVGMAFAPDRGRPYLSRGHLSELYGC